MDTLTSHIRRPRRLGQSFWGRNMSVFSRAFSAARLQLVLCSCHIFAGHNIPIFTSDSHYSLPLVVTRALIHGLKCSFHKIVEKIINYFRFFHRTIACKQLVNTLDLTILDESTDFGLLIPHFLHNNLERFTP